MKSQSRSRWAWRAGGVLWLSAGLTACARPAPPPVVEQIEPEGDESVQVVAYYDPPPLFAAIEDRDAVQLRELIDAGEDVSQVDELYGTPLVAAIQQADREMVDLLLEAGADTGGTAQFFLATLEFPGAVNDAVARRPVEDFARAAGIELGADEQFPGMLVFQLPGERVPSLLQEHQPPLRRQGWFLIRYAEDFGHGPDTMALLPTSEKYAVLAYLGTNGINYDINTEKIINWLQELERTQPFELHEAGFDYLAGVFTRRIAYPRRLAGRMYDFCPDIVDQGIGSVTDLARELAKPDAPLYLWWD